MYSVNITLLWVCIWHLIHKPMCVQPKVLWVPLMGLLFLKVFESCLLKKRTLLPYNTISNFVLWDKNSKCNSRVSKCSSSSVAIHARGIEVLYLLQYPWLVSNARVTSQPPVTVSFLSGYGYRDISIEGQWRHSRRLPWSDRFGRYSASIMAVIRNQQDILFVSCRILFQSVVWVSKFQGSVK